MQPSPPDEIRGAAARGATAATLRKDGRNPRLPARIRLDAGADLELLRPLRVLPGRRLVGEARLLDRPVLAKLFIGSGSARYWRRECAGVRALEAAGIPTPALLRAGRLADGGHYLLTAFLPGAHTLAEAPLGADAVEQLLVPAARLVARMHASGLRQTDLHLGNLLVHQRSLQVIDGDGVRRSRAGRPVRQRHATANLATFLALLPARLAAAPRLLAAYRAAGAPLAATDAAIVAQSLRVREQRLAKQLRKCFRDCTRFRVERSIRGYAVALRSEFDWLAPVLADPEAWIGRAAPRGSGESAGRVTLAHDGHAFVIQEFPPGPWRARFAGCVPPGTAAHAWREANRLQLCGIAGPRPLALVEARFGPLRRRAWLVTEPDGQPAQ